MTNSNSVTVCRNHPLGKLPEGKGLWQVPHVGCGYPTDPCDCYCGINCEPAPAGQLHEAEEEWRPCSQVINETCKTPQVCNDRGCQLAVTASPAEGPRQQLEAANELEGFLSDHRNIFDLLWNQQISVKKAIEALACYRAGNVPALPDLIEEENAAAQPSPDAKVEEIAEHMAANDNLWNTQERVKQSLLEFAAILRRYFPQVSAPSPPPKEDWSTMNIYAKNGDKVVFAHPDNGYDGDRADGRKHLKVGQVYTVDRTEVHSSYTNVWLKEFPQTWFNSVLFNDVGLAGEATEGPPCKCPCHTGGHVICNCGGGFECEMSEQSPAPAAPEGAAPDNMLELFCCSLDLAMRKAIESGAEEKYTVSLLRNAFSERATAEVRELRAELEQWTKWGVVEVAVRNPQVADYCKYWEERTESAEKFRDEYLETAQRIQGDFERAKTAYETCEAQLRTAREALQEAINEVREHNLEYQHRTSLTKIAAWEAALSSPQSSPWISTLTPPDSTGWYWTFPRNDEDPLTGTSLPYALRYYMANEDGNNFMGGKPMRGWCAKGEIKLWAKLPDVPRPQSSGKGEDGKV